MAEFVSNPGSTEPGQKSKSGEILEHHRVPLEQIYTTEELERIQSRLTILEEGFKERPPDDMTLWLLKQGSPSLLGEKPLTNIILRVKDVEVAGQTGIVDVTQDSILRLSEYINFLQKKDPNFDVMFHLTTSRTKSITGKPLLLGSLDIFSPSDLLRHLEKVTDEYKPRTTTVLGKIGLKTPLSVDQLLMNLNPVLLASSYESKPGDEIIKSLPSDEMSALYGIIYGYPEGAIEDGMSGDRSLINQTTRSRSEVIAINHNDSHDAEVREAMKKYEAAAALFEELIAETLPITLPKQYDDYFSTQP